MIVKLALLLIIIYIYVYYETNIDAFMVYWSGKTVIGLNNVENYPNYPFWNSRVGQTSNMSYDLRGDPLIIPKYPFMWNYSTLTPIHNKTLC